MINWSLDETSQLLKSWNKKLSCKFAMSYCPGGKILSEYREFWSSLRRTTLRRFWTNSTWRMFAPVGCDENDFIVCWWQTQLKYIYKNSNKNTQNNIQKYLQSSFRLATNTPWLRLWQLLYGDPINYILINIEHSSHIQYIQIKLTVSYNNLTMDQPSSRNKLAQVIYKFTIWNLITKTIF